MMEFEIGEVYRIDHVRKGDFLFLVNEVFDDQISGVVVQGRATMMSRGGDAIKGDGLTMMTRLIRSATKE